MSLIDTGIEKGLIKFDEDKNFIIYIHQNKKRNYNNPEEKVQAQTFLTLVLNYGYPVNRIQQFVSVQMGVDTTKQADIIVYDDDDCEQPYIIAECKKEEISEQEFQQAVLQAESYGITLSAKYIWITSGLTNEYYQIPKNRPKAKKTITDIPKFGNDKLSKYRYVKGGIDPKNPSQKYFDLEIVNENELVKKFKTIHDALYSEGYTPESALDEVNKLIFCKLFDEKRPIVIGTPYLFQIYETEGEGESAEQKALDELEERIQKLYKEGSDFDPNIFQDTIRLPKEKLKTLVKYLEGVNLSDTDLDSKGKAFETFASETFRGHMGAFFTPRPIVEFIVNTLPIEYNHRVLDTSCGSGGFLLYVLNKVRTQADNYYSKENEPVKHKAHWHNFASKNLFGIELGEKIARTAKMNMIIHDDGHTNVITADGLLKAEILRTRTKNEGFKNNSFDFIVTNPPFAGIVKLVEKGYIKDYNLGVNPVDWLDIKNSAVQNRDTQTTAILFLEQCYNFLTEHGYLAIVIPDGILTNSSLQYVRDNIEEMYRIVAVVSMPQTAFSATGAGVKTSVLFLRKHKTKQTEKISNQKAKLKQDLKADNKYFDTVEKWEKEKTDTIKGLERDAKIANPNATKAEINEIIQSDKSVVQTIFTDKVNLYKEELTEKYFLAKKALSFGEGLGGADYPIFMAIAEDIGYDATGRNTTTNELLEIGKELQKFIAHINKTEK